MSWLRRTPLVGAYVCPAGVFAVEFERRRGGYGIARSFESVGNIHGPVDAGRRLVDALGSAGIRHGEIAVIVRGFGVVHHVLQMPPAPDDVLDPVIDREIRRLDPDVVDPVVGWTSLPALRSVEAEAPGQRSILAIAAPRALVEAFETQFRAAGLRLQHLTALPAGMQRLIEEFEAHPQSVALISPLPDGAFLGLALDGALRIVIEPPLPQDPEHELAALTEEAQLGMLFIRQQFRGATVQSLSLAGSKHSLRDADRALSERLGIPVERYPIGNLTPAAYAALGAVLDARSAAPLSLSGKRVHTHRSRAAAGVETGSYAALGLVLLLSGLVAVQAFRSYDAVRSLRAAELRLGQAAASLAPLRSVALQRRAAEHAVHAVRLASEDRAAIQSVLVGISASLGAAIRLDSLDMQWTGDHWAVALTGQASSESNARAVQWVNDFYREIPRRVPVESVALDQLTYRDESSPGEASVGFRLSFDFTPERRP